MNDTSADARDDLRTGVRRFLAQHASSEKVRHSMSSALGHDPQVWRQMAQQLGLCAIAIPEEFGGAGGGAGELGIVIEEMGRVLLPGPYLATVTLAGQALVHGADAHAQARWLPSIADGALTATLAVREDGQRWALDGIRATARHTAGGMLISGTKMFVVDAHSAELLLVVARAEDGLALFAVTADAPGLTRRCLSVLDPTRRLGRVEFDDTPAERIGPPADATDRLQRILDLCVVAVAAEQVGGAARCLDDAVAYAKARRQFGRPIGSFQAIKHKCADTLLHVESARSAAYHAADIADDPDSDELAAAAALAGSYCAGTYTHSAKENIQIHGGIGYTWEHDAQLHLKRAKSSELLFGTPVQHRRRLAELVGI